MLHQLLPMLQWFWKKKTVKPNCLYEQQPFRFLLGVKNYTKYRLFKFLCWSTRILLVYIYYSSCSEKYSSKKDQARPQCLLFQNGGAGIGTPGQDYEKYSKHPGRFCRVKHDEMSSFRLNNGFRLPEQTRLPIAGDNLRKRHFTVCRVTKYSTILIVFWQPPGTSTRAAAAILKAEKALGRG